MRIIIENVRSFCDVQEVPIRPLTLLLGENSTGKTTFLAMLAHVHQPEFPSTRPSFNIPPFDLGTFDSIATYKGGRYGRAGEFSVGFEEEREGERRLIATYANYRGQPQLVKLSAKGRGSSIEVAVDASAHAARVSMSTSQGATQELALDLQRFPADPGLPFEFFFRTAVMEAARKLNPETGAGFPGSAHSYQELASLLRSARRRVFALAPVRTKPRRTYDEFSDEFDPEGDHVPVILSRLEEEEDLKKTHLLDVLNEFGEMSGLYERIGVRHLGRRPSDPFQILVTMAGPPANLLDVGYGVSQSLPIVAQSVLASDRGVLLLQQPEVHLHPRGQAALGSFFARLVGREKKELVIETHSDYIVDRIRVEVAQGTIRPADVSILFFEKEYIETRVHEITLDERGNIVGAPPSYRRFFLEEEMNLFTRAKE